MQSCCRSSGKFSSLNLSGLFGYLKAKMFSVANWVPLDGYVIVIVPYDVLADCRESSCFM